MFQNGCIMSCPCMVLFPSQWELSWQNLQLNLGTIFRRGWIMSLLAHICSIVTPDTSLQMKWSDRAFRYLEDFSIKASLQKRKIAFIILFTDYNLNIPRLVSVHKWHFFNLYVFDDNKNSKFSPVCWNKQCDKFSNALDNNKIKSAFGSNKIRANIFGSLNETK